jgi:hypothetical protein
MITASLYRALKESSMHSSVDRSVMTAPLPGGLRAVLGAALVMLALPLAACGTTDDAADAAASSRAKAAADNWNFEAGDFRGWRTEAAGSGGWHVYRDGATAPDPSDSDPNFPFAVPDPP